MTHQLTMAAHVASLLLWIGATPALAAVLRWHGRNAERVGEAALALERRLWLAALVGAHVALGFGITALVQVPTLLEHPYMHIKITAAVVMFVITLLVGRAMKMARKAPTSYTAPTSLATMQYTFVVLAVAAVFLIQLRVP